MKRLIGKMVVVCCIAIAIMFASSSAYAQYHTGATLVCSDCHTMHYSEEGGTPAGADATGPYRKLLKREFVADLCLNCHDGTNSNAPDVFNVGADPETPGGDFNYVAGAVVVKGHDVGGTNIGNDTSPANSPGGTFAASGLTCTSCHDVHGSSAANDGDSFGFRMLKKTVNSTDVSGTITSVNADEADIRDPGVNVATNDANHNIYKGNFGGWCAACHGGPGAGGFHGSVNTDASVGDGTDWIRHPTNTAMTPYIGNYGGTYNFNYPIEEVGGTWTTANTGATAATDKVFCLSCHKAHATNFTDSTRWDNGAASGSGANCNKCHAK